MQSFIEFIGYLASVVVLISFCIKNIKLLRLLNNLGALLFLVYTIYYQRYPLIFLNIMVMIVNFYYIFKKEDK